MLRRLFALLLQLLVATVACTTARGDGLIPFATDVATTLSFSEAYTDTVFYDTDFEDYDTVPSTTLALDAKASMTGVDPALFDEEDASFAVDLNDLSVEFFFMDGVRTTNNGRTTVAWKIIGTDPRTLDDVITGSAWVRWSSTEIVFHIEVADDPDDYAIIAPDYAGVVDTVDQFPINVTLSVGPYGIDGRGVYVSGTSELYDKTVGSGDTEQTFTDLAKVRMSGFVDSSKPNVAIVEPASHATVNDSPFTASGTCGDNVGISLVEVRINDGNLFLRRSTASGVGRSAGLCSLRETTRSPLARPTRTATRMSPARGHSNSPNSVRSPSLPREMARAK